MSLIISQSEDGPAEDLEVSLDVGALKSMFEATMPKNEIISKMKYSVQKNNRIFWVEA
jgi:hypothetical protein